VYYIAAKSYVESSAGVKAMHILCDRLNQFGYEAYLVPIDGNINTNPLLLTPILSREKWDSHLSNIQTVIAVYDESIIGNPLNCPIIVKWYLNRPSFLAGSTRTSKELNLINFVFAEEIEANLPRLFLNTVDFPFFLNAPVVTDRKLKLFYAGKMHSLGIKVVKPDDAIEIHRSGTRKQSREELRELFSRASIFYVAEDTAMVLEAAICGCPSIHMKEYFKNPPLTQIDGGIGLVGFEGEEFNYSRDFFERYFVTLQIRERSDLAKFIIRTQNALFNDNFQKITPRYKFPKSSKLIVRLYKLKAAMKQSGLRGFYAVLYAHYLARRINN
jgi:hypothetical protein